MNKLEILLVFLAVVCAVIISTLFTTAIAGGKHEVIELTINNYYESPASPPITNTNAAPVTSDSYTITEGISDSNLSEGLAGAMAIGAHQFDYSTQDYQGSVTGAYYEGENAISLGIAKRWDKVNALFHASTTQINSDYAVVVGGTFRF